MVWVCNLNGICRNLDHFVVGLTRRLHRNYSSSVENILCNIWTIINFNNFSQYKSINWNRNLIYRELPPVASSNISSSIKWITPISLMYSWPTSNKHSFLFSSSLLAILQNVIHIFSYLHYSDISRDCYFPSSFWASASIRHYFGSTTISFQLREECLLFYFH